MNSLKKWLKKYFGKDMYDLQYGRETVVTMAHKAFGDQNTSLKILDVGLGQGTDIMNIDKSLPGQHDLYGIENYEPYKVLAQKQNISVVDINIEQDTFPFEDGTFDLIIINQVLEHTKELYFILSEIQRVLKPDGICIVGVPNLASWHERIRLLIGKQPNCIRIAGPHIRGFTTEGFHDFLELRQCFKVIDFKGSYFYGLFFKKLNQLIAALFPKLCVSIFFTIKHGDNRAPFTEYLEIQMLETNYFRGNS